MGKTTRWFRSLLGLGPKKSPPSGGDSQSRPAKHNKSKRGITDHSRGGPNGLSTESFSTPYIESVDANKHAIAVAAATAAVAEAALAAAHAAAEVVRLTSSVNRGHYLTCGTDHRREWAAVKLQSAFRAYLARRALKALKALVKLQALVRGHIVRKQSAHMLQRMQAMAQIQARACAHRIYTSDSPHSSSNSSHPRQPGLVSRSMFDHQLRAYDAKINGLALKISGPKPSIRDNNGQGKKQVDSHWLEENLRNRHRDSTLKNGHADDEKSDKILEVDTWKPHMNLKQGDKAVPCSRHGTAWNHNDQIFTPFESLSRLSTKSQIPSPSSSPHELSSASSSVKVNHASVWALDNSPGDCSASSRPGSSSRRGPFTPERSEGSRSFFSSYTSHPSYMAYTESSRAKVRSQSAPRQRLDFEKTGSTKRIVHGYWDEDTSSERGWSLQGNFRSRAYPGSGRLENLGMSLQGNGMGHNPSDRAS